MSDEAESRELSPTTVRRIEAAVLLTKRQMAEVEGLLDELGLGQGQENRLAMLQVLASNYAAEVERAKRS